MTTPTNDKKQDPNTLIVLDGIVGISRADAMKFLDYKRSLLDAKSTPNDYLTMSLEYDSIGALTEAAEMYQKYEELYEQKQQQTS